MLSWIFSLPVAVHSRRSLMLQAFTGVSEAEKGGKQISVKHLHRKIRKTKPTKQIANQMKQTLTKKRKSRIKVHPPKPGIDRSLQGARLSPTLSRALRA